MEEPYKDLDQFTKNWMNETELQNPSNGFSDRVLHVIEKSKAITTFTPLISKRAWFIGIGIVAIGLVVYFLQPTQESDIIPWLKGLQLSESNVFSGIKVSNTVIYAFTFLALFLVQIPVLKIRHKKFNL